MGERPICRTSARQWMDVLPVPACLIEDSAECQPRAVCLIRLVSSVTWL
jgi:hypothetical protein